MSFVKIVIDKVRGLYQESGDGSFVLNGVDVSIVNGTLTLNGSAVSTGSDGGSPGGGSSAFYAIGSSIYTTSSINTTGSITATGSVAAASFTGATINGITPGPITERVWVVAASQTSSMYANGLTYVPMIKSAGDTVDFQFCSALSGTLGINVNYAMSAAHTGAIGLRLDYLRLTDGTLPSADLTTGSVFAITPGDTATKRTLSASMNSSLQLATTYGDHFMCTLNRVTSSEDTHTGDIRIFDIRVSKV